MATLWMGVQLGRKHIFILSNLLKYKMATTENEPEVRILLTSVSNWPIKETSLPRSFRHCCHNVKLCQVHQPLLYNLKT